MRTPHQILATLLTAAVFPVCAGSLINLEVDFETPFWNEFLRNNWGPSASIVKRDGGGHALRIEPGRSVKTQLFRLPEDGRLKAGFEVRNHGITPGGESWRVAQASITYYRGNQPLPHSDLYLDEREASWRQIRYAPSVKPVGADGFSISFTNYGKSGAFEIDNFQLSIEVDGNTLTGDPFFQERLGVNHWYPAKGDLDWDRMTLASPNGSATVRTDRFAGQNVNSLLLHNNATVRSARFSYNGERLLFGAWARRKKLKRPANSPSWASAGMQLVWFGSDGKRMERAHSDVVPLLEGSAGWTYFQTEITAGSRSRKTRGFELWPRIWPGVTGELEFSGVTVIQTAGVARRPYDEKHGEITVDASRPGEEIPVIWNAMDLCFVDAVSQKSIRDGLLRLRNEIGLTHLRIREFLQAPQIYQGLTGSGEVMLDFRRLDKWMDFLVRDCGFVLTPTIESTPNALSSRPLETPGYHNIYPPRDYDRWAEVVQRLVEHWIDRYGTDTVAAWNFECWNEPAASGYFKGTDEEFVKLYAAYMKALTGAEKSRNVKLRIGTASDVSMSRLYPAVFEDQKKRGTLKNIDFISMHIYGGYMNSVYAHESGARAIAELRDSYPELKGKPVYITEYNGSDREHPANDRHTGCAFNIKAVRLYLDNGISRGYFFPAISSIYHGVKDRHFANGLEAVTKTGIQKAVVHSFRLLNALKGTRRLPLAADHDPFDGIAGITNDGGLRIVLSTFAEENLLRFDETSLTLRVKWPNHPDRVKITALRVDRDHGDPFTEYQRRGEPPISRSPALAEDLKSFSVLEEEEVSGWKFDGDTLVMPLKLQINSSILLKIDRTAY